MHDGLNVLKRIELGFFIGLKLRNWRYLIVQNARLQRQLAPHESVDDRANGARLALSLSLEHGQRLWQHGSGEDRAQARWRV